MFGIGGDDSNPSFESSAPCNNLGFLQKNNNLEEKISSFKERSSKDLLDNSDRDSRFRRTETDFSNLFARGRCPDYFHYGKCRPMNQNDVGNLLMFVLFSCFTWNMSQFKILNVVTDAKISLI